MKDLSREEVEQAITRLEEMPNLLISVRDAVKVIYGPNLLNDFCLWLDRTWMQIDNFFFWPVWHIEDAVAGGEVMFESAGFQSLFDQNTIEMYHPLLDMTIPTVKIEDIPIRISPMEVAKFLRLELSC